MRNNQFSSESSQRSMRRRLSARSIWLTSAIPMLFLATGASAQNVLMDEIVVTAQKREENVQNVPLAVSAFSGEQLKAMNIQDATRIVDLVPNFKAGGLGGSGGPPFFSIRGISFIDFSNVNEASVAVYLDEVYQASQGIGVAQTYDVGHVEVLRGPQGTLFGRNATAGVVSFQSKKPTEELDGYASLQYGQYNQVIWEGAIGGQIADGFRARLAGKWNRDDGWQKNQLPAGGRAAKVNSRSVRLTTQYDITPDWMLELQGHYSRNKGLGVAQTPYYLLGPPNAATPGTPLTYCAGRDATGALIRPVPGTPNDQIHADCVSSYKGYNRAGFKIDKLDPQKVYFDYAFPFQYKAYGTYGKLLGKVGDATLTSITAYEKYSQLFGYDFDNYDNRPYGAGPPDVHSGWRSGADQVSHETRLNGEYNGVKYVGGVYFYRAHQRSYSGTEFDIPYNLIEAEPASIGLAIDPRNTKALARTTTQSYAVFGQVDAPIGETLTISAGVRYTNDTRKIKLQIFPACGSGPGETAANRTNLALASYCGDTNPTSIANEAATGRLALEWRPGEDQLYFLQYSHGFKSGGFNPVRVTAQRGPVDAETVDSWEAGMKRYFLDRKLRLNASLFYYKFTAIQALIGSSDPLTGASLVNYINAGDPRTYGAELEATWAVTDQLEIAANVGLLDTKIIANPSFTNDGRVLNGNHLAQAPAVSTNGIVRYTIPLGDAGSVTLQGDGRWQSKSYGGIDNDPSEVIPKYAVFNARVQWRNAARNITLEGFVDNVFDKGIIQHVFHPTLGSYPTTITATLPSFDSGFRSVGRPRLWGAKLTYDFK
jgi:iron complex outermembrane recepter protein